MAEILATFNLETINNGVASTTATFADIPTTASSTIAFSVTNDVPTAPVVDLDGNGTTDFTVADSSVGADPLAYVRSIEAAVTAMPLSKSEEKELGNQLTNIERQIAASQKECKIKKGCRIIADIQKFLLKLQINILQQYIEQQAALAAKSNPHKSNTQVGIPADQAEIILDMINQLAALL